MIQQTAAQKLPSSGSAREALREKGQFWTPPWVAEAMVAWCLLSGSDSLFDPAVGAGAFFQAARAIEREQGRQLKLLGAEVDPQALQQALAGGLSLHDLAAVEIRDFVLHPPPAHYSAIVANPPYIRHHRLALSVKEQLRMLAAKLMGTTLDGRAGLHVYFLLRAIELLAPNGRLAFIMPADTCEGVYAPTLWRWITAHYCLDAVITFAPEASPFPKVDTNPLIFLVRNASPQSLCVWAKVHSAGTDVLKNYLASDFREAGDGLETMQCETAEAVRQGLSRRPLTHSTLQSGNQEKRGLRLGDLARVMRGIATGANEFFFLTRQQSEDLKIPGTMLLPAVGRTRDVPGEVVAQETLLELEAAGRPTLLFAPDGRDLELFPESVQKYLRKGQEIGLPQRPLIAQRRPWYRMETRKAPAFLFAYLGRRNTRFIRNFAGVMPLTGFLCVYPHQDDPASVEKLWRILQHPDAINNLALVGKSYGAGAIKVEPRALEKLPIPESVIATTNLSITAQQMSLLEIA